MMEVNSHESIVAGGGFKMVARGRKQKASLL
jgi:hypothetical protein